MTARNRCAKDLYQYGVASVHMQMTIDTSGLLRAAHIRHKDLSCC